MIRLSDFHACNIAWVNADQFLEELVTDFQEAMVNFAAVILPQIEQCGDILMSGCTAL
jgi:hypothetical protein